ncbi:MAG TPA: DNA-binding domain-containing protein [Stellaceae bacterium]|nr:DNA-binding domain-containing protein [Stellaceae bacterium]
MPTLLEVQRAMRQSVVEGADAAILGVVMGDDLRAAERLRVYRGNSASALVEALRLSYPAIDKLVGAECFTGCARRFIALSPPRTPWLYAYGGEFGGFLASLPSLASLSYLEDVARLEWAINAALHAPDHDGLDATALRALAAADPDVVRLERHPGLGLLRVDSPADVIWRAVLEDDDATLARLDPAEGPHWLLVERDDAGLRVGRLTEAAWRFTAALFAGKTIAAALQGLEDLDAASLLADHFRSRRIIAAHFDGRAGSDP